MKLTTFIKEKFVLPKSTTLDDSALVRRDEMVLRSQSIPAVVDAKSLDRAVACARDIRTEVKDVKAAGLALRRPLTEAAARIKAVEDEYLTPLLEEQSRVERLYTDFQQAEARRVAEEERKQAELRRKAEAERLAKEEEARKAQEAAERAAAEATNKKQRLAAEKLAAEARQRQEQADAAAQQSQAIIQAPLPAATKAAGMATKRVVKWVITDENALFKARPELFKREVKPAAINAVCFPNNLEASEANPDTTSVPGLKLWYAYESVTKKW